MGEMANPADHISMDLDLLDRYLSGSCSEEERRETDAHVAADRGLATRLEELRRGSLATPVTMDEVRQEWGRLAAAIDAVTPDTRPHPVQHRVRIRRVAKRSVLGVPVAATLLAAAVVAFWFVRPGFEPHRAPVEVRVVEAARGQRARVTLGDGTVVTLRGGSVLRYPQAFADSGERRVELDGEAFFEVTHSDKTPFIVDAGSGRARVLGTKFAVRAIAGLPALQLVVAEGRVAFGARGSREDSARVFTAWEVGLLDSVGHLSIRKGVDVDAHLGWMEGRTDATSTAFREIIPLLERQLGITINVRPGFLADRKVTLTIYDNQGMADIAERLGALLDARASVSGTTITLTQLGEGAR
jgi:transmembrane sensor